jgi:hypothetical protein
VLMRNAVRVCVAIATVQYQSVINADVQEVNGLVQSATLVLTA